MYAFPPETDGSGQTIAIIELGGGFVQSDLDTYFAGLGITAPTVTAVGRRRRIERPGGQTRTAPTARCMLDIEVAGALAPGADIVVYFAPNTDAGLPRRGHHGRPRRPDTRGDQHQLGPDARTSGRRRRARRSTRRSRMRPRSA